MNPVAQYVLSLATCVIGYFTYLKYAVPAIENPAGRPRQFAHQRSNASIPKIQKSGMIPLLPPKAWELNDCKTLITSTGTVLFKEVLHQPDGSVKLSPFTLMTNVGEAILLPSVGSPTTDSPPANQKTPLVLRTAEGAILKLNKPFTEALQGGTEIQSARLLGEVDIYRPPSGPNKNDVLHVLTRNVQVDRNRIYTLDTLDKPFLFSYGPHRGRGRNLIIDLIHSNNSVAGKQDFSSISGVRRLELAYLDRLRIVPSAARASANQPANKLFGGQDAPLEVSCKGPCVFDFAEQTVSFSDQVVVKKISSTPDTLACQQLRIKFDQNPLAGSQPTAAHNQPKQELGIESFIAEGSPVVVNAISRPAKITAARLTYDAATDVITGVAGTSSGGMVILVTPEIQYKTEQLSCKLATGTGDKKTLDALSSSGPGQLLKLGKTPKEEMFVHWTKSLNTTRDRRDPSIQTLVLKGSPHVKFQETSTIDAERIDLKLKRFETARDNAVQTEFAVMEVVANQNVRIATPDITGNTDRLIAEFPKPLKLKSHQVSRPRYLLPGDQNRPLKNNSRDTPQLTSPIDKRSKFGVVAPNLVSPKTAKLPSKKHLNFSGQQVRISILEATSDKLSFDELIISGDVSVFQKESKESNSSKTFELKGDHLRLVPQVGEDRFRLELNSTTNDASLDSPEFTIVGQKINFDQVDNKLWVEGPGQCNFDNSEVATERPFSVANRGGFSQSARLGNSRPKAKKISKFEASWQGGMIFDGRKIYLEREVVSKTDQFDGTKQNVTLAHCGQMSVALNRYVNFEQLKQDDGKGLTKPQDIKPTELIFIDQVDPLNQVFGQVPVADNLKPSPPLISNRFFDGSGKLIQQQTISSKKVRVDPVSKNIFTDGPGWFSTHDLRTFSARDAKQSSPHPLAGMAGKRNDPSKPITFVRANFSGQMEIEAPKNQMTIRGRVRSVHLQTDDWNTNTDPDRIPTALQASATLLTSERLTLARWQPRDATEPTHEMIADGNVRIFGDTIDLSANRVSYNQANDMLVVNGTTRTAAQIRYRQSTGPTKSWQEFSAEKFEYQIASQTVNVSGVRKGEAIRID